MQGQYWIFLLILTILAIEIVLGRHKGVHRRHDFFMLGTVIIASQGTRIAMAWLTATLIGLLIPDYKNLLTAAPFWSSLLVLFLVAEFLQYWIHRLAHNSRKHPLLYGMHRTHHSAPYVNVTLMWRTNLLWPFVHSYTWVTAVAIYLGLYAQAAAFYTVIMAWNALTHSDWRWDDAIIAHLPGGAKLVRAAEWIVVTPRLHHVHHGYGRDGANYRNFCTFFSFYDRLFGTLHVPEGRPWRYGMPGGEHHWVRQLLFPLVSLGDAKKS